MSKGRTKKNLVSLDKDNTQSYASKIYFLLELGIYVQATSRINGSTLGICTKSKQQVCANTDLGDGLSHLPTPAELVSW